MAQRLRKAKAGARAENQPRVVEAVGMAEALEAAKLRSLYQFAYGLSHEINNPLTNIATRAQTLMVDEQDPERRRKLAVIVQQAFRAHEMIADLMLFANPPDMRPERTDVVKVVETVIQEVKPLAAEKKIRVTRVGEVSSVMATADPVHIAVALKAVVQNAMEAVREKGTIEVGVFAATGSPADYKIDGPHQAVPPPTHANSNKTRMGLLHRLTIKDDGPGISPEAREHIFDPYFSGREAGRGLGLGLSKAWRIVDLHGGRIEAASRDGGGAEFSIWLPADAD